MESPRSSIEAVRRVDKMLLSAPIARGMSQLDRSFFKKTVRISAARVFDNQKISELRKRLSRSRDLARLERISPVIPDPDAERAREKRRCLLLKPEVKDADPSTWSSTLQELVRDGVVGIIPHSLHLDYEYWNFNEIMQAIFPPLTYDDIPAGFSIVGHVAHFNLRSPYIAHKHMIGQLVLDKSPGIRTVINKTADVGSSSEYRTFSYELLAGDPSLDVDTHESGCTFKFNWAKVYWNPRLSTEHRRILAQLGQGEAVCDVMAGVGPFAVPAGKQRVFCWANDLNPDCYASMKANIAANKVSDFVRPFNQDGHTFIREAAQQLLETSHSVKITPKTPKPHRRLCRPASSPPNPPNPPKAGDDEQQHRPLTVDCFVQPRTFAHYIMNLPASALSFLPSFIGLYSGHRELFEPHTTTKLPLIHCYCFAPKTREDSDNDAAEKWICEEICRLLQVDSRVSESEEEDVVERLKREWELEIWDVRDVAPNKRMFCASFRLAPDVAFAVPSGSSDARQ